MTLPASGTITLGQVAGELGIGLPLSLGDSRVLALAGKSAPPISLSDLYGKSAMQPLTATYQNGSATVLTGSAQGGVGLCYPSVTPSGGTAPYSYQWSFTSSPASMFLTESTSATCTVHCPYNNGQSGTVSAVLQCVISDSGGHTLTVQPVAASITFSPH